MHEILFFGLLIAFFIVWILAMNFLRGRIRPDNRSGDGSADNGGSSHSYDGGHGGGFDGFGGGESGGGGADVGGH